MHSLDKLQNKISRIESKIDCSREFSISLSIIKDFEKKLPVEAQCCCEANHCKNIFAFKKLISVVFRFNQMLLDS